MQVIARCATARSTERLNLSLRREVFEKPEQDHIQTESCQALVHMDKCYICLLVLVVCTLQY